MNGKKNIIKGLPVSPGIAVGKVFLFNEEKIKIPQYISSFDLEQARLGQAMQTAKLELVSLKETLEKLGEDAKMAYVNYLSALEDPEFLKEILIKIRDESVNAEWAIKNIPETNSNVIHDISLNLTLILLKKKKKLVLNFPEPVILVARDLTLIEAASINPKIILGFLTDSGVFSSQASILARCLTIPAIASLKNITTKIKNGNIVAIDGDTGMINF